MAAMTLPLTQASFRMASSCPLTFKTIMIDAIETFQEFTEEKRKSANRGPKMAAGAIKRHRASHSPVAIGSLII